MLWWTSWSNEMKQQADTATATLWPGLTHPSQCHTGVKLICTNGGAHSMLNTWKYIWHFISNIHLGKQGIYIYMPTPIVLVIFGQAKQLKNTMSLPPHSTFTIVPQCLWLVHCSSSSRVTLTSGPPLTASACASTGTDPNVWLWSGFQVALLKLPGSNFQWKQWINPAHVQWHGLASCGWFWGLPATSLQWPVLFSQSHS